ncbi:MAG: hypothetical protein WDO15_00495 [Bacteroidota bacterium]
MKPLFLLAFLCIVYSGIAQQTFIIKEINKGDGYSFPLIVSTQRPAVAKKINTMIQEGLGADPTLKNPFDSLQGEDEYYYQVGVVNDRVISLIAGGAHSGCGYHVTEHAYNIDSRTGEPITVNSMFVGAAKTKLAVAIFASWKSKLDALRESGDDSYKECIEGLDQATSFSDDQIWKMLITDSGIKFWAGQCLDGSEYSRDQTVGPHELLLADLKTMLNPYGYSLFVERPSQAPMYTLMAGKIDGKYAITMILLPEKNGTLTGVLSYDRVGEPLNLSGTVTGNQIVFHELDASEKPISDFTATWDGTKLNGTFLNLKSKKQMTFVAAKK